MINLRLLNRGLRGTLTHSEFVTLYAIESALGRKNEWRKIYYDMLSDVLNVSKRQAKRYVDGLVEKGFILRWTKQVTKTKRESFYKLNLAILELKSDENGDKFDTESGGKNAQTVLLNNYNDLNKNKQYKTNENDVKQPVNEEEVFMKEVYG